MQHIFLNNYQLCSEIGEPVLQHFVHLLATHGRHVQYLDFLHTVIKAEGKYVKKCQDMIMTEVRVAEGCSGNSGSGQAGPRLGGVRQWVIERPWGAGLWRGLGGELRTQRLV